MRALIYKLATGEISHEINAPMDHVTLQPAEDEGWVLADTATPQTHYYDLDMSALQPKRSMGLVPNKVIFTADGVDSVIIDNVPAGVTVQWHDWTSDVVWDGVVEFDVDQPGRYMLTFSGIEYLPQEIELEAIN